MEAGDVLGIQYTEPPDPDLGTGIVPYEASNQGVPLCCNLHLANLSHTVNRGRIDEQFNIGSILDSGIILAKRIPALVAEVRPT